MCVCVCVWPARAVIEPICRLAPVGLSTGLAARRWLNVLLCSLNPFCFLFSPPPLDSSSNLSSSKKWLFYWNWSCSRFGQPPPPLRDHTLRILCFAAGRGRFISQGEKKKKGSGKEVGEVSRPRSPLSPTDRCLGLNTLFSAAEFFTLGLVSGMCESGAVPWFTIFNAQVETSRLDIFYAHFQPDISCWDLTNTLRI